MDDILTPKHHAEAIAIFRAQVIGPLLCRDERLHGDLAAAIRELAQTPVKPPGSETHRTYSVPTLQRWYYAFRRNGLAGLTPQARSDRGYAHALSSAERNLLLQIRRENPGVAATVILNTLLAEGRPFEVSGRVRLEFTVPVPTPIPPSIGAVEGFGAIEGEFQADFQGSDNVAGSIHFNVNVGVRARLGSEGSVVHAFAEGSGRGEGGVEFGNGATRVYGSFGFQGRAGVQLEGRFPGSDRNAAFSTGWDANFETDNIQLGESPSQETE